MGVPRVEIPRSGSISANVANIFEDYEGSIDSSVLTASGIGTSIYTAVSDSLSEYFGESVVPTEGDQIVRGDISPYMGVKVPLPAPVPIPVEGDVQIFANPECTEYATGSVSTVYARINVPWGFGEGWAAGSVVSDSISCFAPSSENPGDYYGLAVWDDFLDLADRNVPYSEGQIVQLKSVSADDITEFTKVFSKP